MIASPPESPFFPYPTLFRSAAGRFIRFLFRKPAAGSRRGSRHGGTGSLPPHSQPNARAPARRITSSPQTSSPPPCANADRKSTRLELQSPCKLVFRPLLVKK